MTSPNLLDRPALIQIALILMLIMLFAGGAGLYVLTDPALRQSRALYLTAVAIDEMYQEPVDWDELMRSAKMAMTDRLDRYSGYVTDEDFAEMRNQRSGTYGGIGAVISSHERGLRIITTVEDGPADMAGVLNGDLFIMADSTSLVGLSVSDASDLLRGEEGSQVVVQVLRPGPDDTLKIEITRDRVPYIHVPYAGYGPDSVIYIRLDDFDSGAADAVEEAVDSLTELGQPRGLILDLRGNPGGLYHEAVQVSDLFLESGDFIVGTEGRSRWVKAEDLATGGDIAEGLPMAVMVDRGSASASEITAGALKQAGRAIVVGDTTFGKGLVQGFVRIPGQDGLRLTISRYFLDGRVFLNDFDSTLSETGKGIAPHHLLEPESAGEFAVQIENSLLLQEFVALNQDEIVADGDDGNLDEPWEEEFYRFARSRDFLFKSTISEQIDEFAEILEASQAGTATRRLVRRLREIADRSDLEKFHAKRDYLLRRLWQLALQRKYSDYEAYARVLVPHSPEIARTVELLLQSNEPNPAL